MPRLAILILTKNEEANIEECIKSASFADEIVVIDSGSTDMTQAKAEALGARFVVHPMGDDGFAGQRNFALTQTEAEWVFFLDADERITSDSVSAIRHVVQENIPGVYRIKRLNIMFGQAMYYGVHRPDASDRLFPRVGIHWQGRVHEHVETEIPYYNVNGWLHHYTYDTWEKYFAKSNQYTSLAAQSLFERQKKVGGLGVLLHAFFAFLKAYVLKQGFRDGYLGIIMSIMAAQAALTKYLKLRNIYRIEKNRQK